MCACVCVCVCVRACVCVNSCTCISLFTPASCVLVAADFGQKRLGRCEWKLIGSFLDFMHKACIRQHLCVHAHVCVCKGSSSFIHGADLAADLKQRLGSWEWQLDPYWTWSHFTDQFGCLLYCYV